MTLGGRVRERNGEGAGRVKEDGGKVEGGENAAKMRCNCSEEECVKRKRKREDGEEKGW